MPELPEVETTVRGLRKKILGLRILDVWTDLNTKDPRKKDTVANKKYFLTFQKEIRSRKILSIERQAKNILINLSDKKTILIHMKLTGYLYVGENKNIRFAHVVFSLSNKKYLVFSDLRKFGKITLLDTETAHDSKHLKDIGPDPLGKSFTPKILKERLLKKPNGKIKTILMDQSLIAGIGNIYSDEILWESRIHPERLVKKIKDAEFQKIFKNTQKILLKSIHYGGDSQSDYRNTEGKEGHFQNYHRAYQQTGNRCSKKGCQGVIIRKVINNRSAHFCSKHQI